MNLKLYAALFLPLLTVGTALQGEPYSVLDGDKSFSISGNGLEMTAGKTSGILNISKLDSVPLRGPNGTPPVFFAPVFLPGQMENGAPNLAWDSSIRRENGISRIVQSTLLNTKSAGLDLDGIRMTRTIELRDGDSGIRVSFQFENTGKKPGYVTFGIRNAVSIAANGQDYAYLPTSDNVLDIGNGSFWNYYTRTSDWQNELVEGWIGLNNRVLRRGIAFRFDYNTVESAYTGPDGLTRGWTVTGGFLSPGKQFISEFVLTPVKGLSGIYYAGENFCAGFSGEGESVVLEIAPTGKGAFQGNLSAADVNGRKLGEKTFSLESDGKTVTVPLTVGKPSCQSVVKAVVNGQPFEQYRENGFRMQTIPETPAKFAYHRPVPPKKDVATEEMSSEKISRAKKVLILFGLYTDYNRFDRIFDGWSVTTISAVMNGIKTPPPATTIDDYAVIVLGNVNIESIRGFVPVLIRYVKNGGILLASGGPASFGCGGYDSSPLNGILPVESLPFDLRPVAGDDSVNQGRPIDGTKAMVYWIQKTPLKKDAKIWKKAGDFPVAVESKFGNGRVLCFLASPLGEAPAGETPYWDSPEYVSLMKDLVNALYKEVNP